MRTCIGYGERIRTGIELHDELAALVAAPALTRPWMLSSPGVNLSTVRTFGRYLLFQAPAWLLVAVIASPSAAWLDLPGWTAGALLAGFVAKDLALFPWLRRAYENRPSRFVGVDALVGARGRVEDRLDPRGHVRIGAERWRAIACCDAPLEAGEIVRVLGVTGLELTVEPSSG